jgi:spore germination cell wall hydrolase CwlJ-like protein
LSRFARAATALAALIALANCTAPAATQSTRSVPPEVPAPEVSRGGSGELACLAEAVYFEAGGTGETGQSAVAHVVLNRAKSAKFPRSVCGVVADGCQFSYRCDDRSDALSDPRTRAHAFRVAEAVLAGAPDFTKGALFFHSAQVAPGWFSTRPRVGVFGGNVFYR